VAQFGSGIAMSFGMGEDAAYDLGETFIKSVTSLQTALGALAQGDTTPIVTLIQTWANLLLNWVQTSVIPFIGQKISDLVTTIGTWISTNVPVLVGQLAQWYGAYLNFLATGVIPFIGEEVGKLVTAIGTWITTNAPIVGAKLSEWGTAFLGWVDTYVIPFMAPKLDAIWTSISTWIGTQRALIDAKIAEWGTAFTDWINGAVAALPEKLLAFWTALYTWVSTTATNITANSQQLAEALNKWIGEKAIPWLKTEFPKFLLVLIGLIIAIPAALVITLAVVALALVNGIVDGMKQFITEKTIKLIEMGKDFVNGLVDGINKASAAVFDAFVKLINDNIKAVKDFFGWHSPMPLTRDMGTDMGLGLVLGIKSMGGAVHAAALSLVDSAQSAFNNPMNYSLATASYGAAGQVATMGYGANANASTNSSSSGGLQSITLQNVMDGEVVSEVVYRRIGEKFERELAGEYGGVR
jgi:hypothetical protein